MGLVEKCIQNKSMLLQPQQLQYEIIGHTPIFGQPDNMDE